MQWPKRREYHITRCVPKGEKEEFGDCLCKHPKGCALVKEAVEGRRDIQIFYRKGMAWQYDTPEIDRNSIAWDTDYESEGLVHWRPRGEKGDYPEGQDYAAKLKADAGLFGHELIHELSRSIGGRQVEDFTVSTPAGPRRYRLWEIDVKLGVRNEELATVGSPLYRSPQMDTKVIRRAITEDDLRREMGGDLRLNYVGLKNP